MDNKNISTKIINDELLEEMHTSLENEVIELQEELKKLDKNILNDIDHIEPDWEWLSDIKNGR